MVFCQKKNQALKYDLYNYLINRHPQMQTLNFLSNRIQI